MENGVVWGFKPNENISLDNKSTIRGILGMLMDTRNVNEKREVVPLGHGDPSLFPSFRTCKVAEDAVAEALRSAKFNSYAPSIGMLSARRAVADYLSRGLSNKLSPDDVFLTIGCIQAIETIISVLARPGANILFPRPGFPLYESRSAFSNLEVRHFDLLPDNNWEVDLDNVEALADKNTTAIVIINPGNPCGNVFKYDHLKKVAETAKKLGILVISDEVYGHLTFGSNPFVPMGVFASIVPVLTVGSLSKRWVVPGWRLGWIAAIDPNGVLKESKIYDCIKGYLSISTDPPTFIQAAVPQILEKTKEGFFSNILAIVEESAEICYNEIKEIGLISCPHRPEGSMFLMAKINVSLLDNINDDMDFCFKLAKEESVIILPGTLVGLKGWLRVTFALDPASVKDGMGRLKSFCQRHAKQLQ